MTFAALLLLLPAGASGQEFRGFEITGGYYGWSGSDVEVYDPGFRGQAIIFGEADPTLGFGLAGTYGWVPLDGAGIDGDLKEFGLGILVRKALGEVGRPHVFVEGYAGWTQLRFDLAGGFSNIQENGVAVGPGVGMEFPVGEAVRFVLAGDFHWHSYGEVRLGDGPLVDGTGESGFRWGGRAGLHLSLGSTR
jgi:hypothetical protein